MASSLSLDRFERNIKSSPDLSLKPRQSAPSLIKREVPRDIDPKDLMKHFRKNQKQQLKETNIENLRLEPPRQQHQQQQHASKYSTSSKRSDRASPESTLRSSSSQRSFADMKSPSPPLDAILSSDQSSDSDNSDSDAFFLKQQPFKYTASPTFDISIKLTRAGAVVPSIKSDIEDKFRRREERAKRRQERQVKKKLSQMKDPASSLTSEFFVMADERGVTPLENLLQPVNGLTSRDKANKWRSRLDDAAEHFKQGNKDISETWSDELHLLDHILGAAANEVGSTNRDLGKLLRKLKSRYSRLVTRSWTHFQSINPTSTADSMPDPTPDLTGNGCSHREPEVDSSLSR
eukprot:GILJ01004583.1.p1 GENE.GILJ01004583.1~~GILJ01004583.1.p1  ORF type:complete len:381 (-),score=55.82 GILJ01004583.1:120-1163(-)